MSLQIPKPTFYTAQDLQDFLAEASPDARYAGASAVVGEVSRALIAESALATALTAEVARAIAAETAPTVTRTYLALAEGVAASAPNDSIFRIGDVLKYRSTDSQIYSLSMTLDT